ncbi:MAG: heme-binding protein [Actinobacteria bacterium]|nr:heme-binding protein [Actinomycetota bacterium]
MHYNTWQSILEDLPEATFEMVGNRSNRAIGGSRYLDSHITKGTAMPLTLEEAQAVSARAREHASQLGVRVTVAIVDEGGFPQVVNRMDGAPPLSARIAPAKAASAAVFHRDGTTLRQLQESWPAFFAQIDQVAGIPIMAGAGSQLIRRAGAVLGAIAVSGGRPEQDDECTETALTVLSSQAPQG